MFKKTIAMTGAAALLALGLTGCGATLGGGAQSEEAAASADNQLCVIPRTPTPQLLEAVSAGLKTAGYEVKVLPEDAKTDACDHPEFPSRFRFYTESEPLPTSLISVSCS